MADDSIKTIDDILSQAEIEASETQWRRDIKRQLVPIGKREWLTMQPPPRQILLEHVGQRSATGEYIQEPQDALSMGIVGLLAATGGVGKTQAIIQLALAVASGTRWLGQFDVRSPGHVAIVLAEDTLEEAWRRFYASVQNLGLKEHRARLNRRVWPLILDGPNCRFIDPKTGEPSQTFGDLREALLEAGVDWKLIIIDPASRLMPLDAELDNLVATEFVILLEQLTQIGPSKPTVLVTHHTRKQGRGKAGVRGASALTDGARWVATLTPYGIAKQGVIDNDGHGRVLFELHKSNYGPNRITARMSFDSYGVLRELTKSQKAEELPLQTSSSFTRQSHTQTPLDEVDEAQVKAFEEDL